MTLAALRSSSQPNTFATTASLTPTAQSLRSQTHRELFNPTNIFKTSRPTMPQPPNNHHAFPPNQRTLSTAATNGSNTSRAKSANHSTQPASTSVDDSDSDPAFAMARFLAERPRDSPWNAISMLPAMKAKAPISKAS